MPKAKLERLYSTKDAAVALGVSVPRVKQIREKLNVGTLIGRSLVFTEADIERMRQRDTTRGPKRKGGTA